MYFSKLKEIGRNLNVFLVIYFYFFIPSVLYRILLYSKSYIQYVVLNSLLTNIYILNCMAKSMCSKFDYYYIYAKHFADFFIETF